MEGLFYLNVIFYEIIRYFRPSHVPTCNTLVLHPSLAPWSKCILELFNFYHIFLNIFAFLAAHLFSSAVYLDVSKSLIYAIHFHMPHISGALYFNELLSRFSLSAFYYPPDTGFVKKHHSLCSCLHVHPHYDPEPFSFHTHRQGLHSEIDTTLSVGCSTISLSPFAKRMQLYCHSSSPVSFLCFVCSSSNRSFLAFSAIRLVTHLEAFIARPMWSALRLPPT